MELKLESKFSKDIIYNTIGNFVNLFCLWVITLLVARMLDYENAGVLSLAMVAANIVTSLASFSLRIYYAADIERKFSDEDYVWTRGVLDLSSFVVLFIYCLAMRYSWAIIGSIFLYYTYKAIDWITDIYYGVMQRHGKLYLDGFFLSGEGIFSVGVFAMAAALWKSLNIGLALMVLVAFLTCIGAIITTKKAIGVSVSLKGIRWKNIGRIILLCLPLFIMLALSNALPSVPRLFFERMYSTEELGYYATIATICVLIQTAINCIITPLLPKLSYLYKTGDKKGFFKLRYILYGFCVALGGIAFVAVIFLGDWVLKIAFTESILPYSYVFKWAIIAATVNSLFAIANNALATTDDKRGVIIGSIIGTALCIGISYPFCYFQYMNGISFSLIVAGFVEFAIFEVWIIFRVKKHTPELPANSEGEKTNESEANEERV